MLARSQTKIPNVQRPISAAVPTREHTNIGQQSRLAFELSVSRHNLARKTSHFTDLVDAYPS